MRRNYSVTLTPLLYGPCWSASTTEMRLYPTVVHFSVLPFRKMVSRESRNKLKKKVPTSCILVFSSTWTRPLSSHQRLCKCAQEWLFIIQAGFQFAECKYRWWHNAWKEFTKLLETQCRTWVSTFLLIATPDNARAPIICVSFLPQAVLYRWLHSSNRHWIILHQRT
jgi:hypothetical protein